MDELSKKLINNFPGKVVRKDLSALIKKGSNVPTYVLEYLLGMYCSTDDEDILKLGLQSVSEVLSKNYVRPDESEYVKSKIRENGSYTVIDKITVKFNEKEDKYIAYFTNLKIDPFEVDSNLVVNNEKLLLGGIWCIVTIEYHKTGEIIDGDEAIEDLFGRVKEKKQKKAKPSKFASNFHIENIKPIQMPSLDLESIIKARANYTKDEWIGMILRSAGYEYTELNEKEKLHYLLRLVPLIQKNYNLVELGPRGTGKSHVYSEISPYSILISGGHTTSSNLFYNMGRRTVGLVGCWDCVAFDEVGGLDYTNVDTIQILKNYMANASFARGKDSITADASIVFGGNTNRVVSEMLRTSHLFEPFPPSVRDDAAFFDRIHAYLPGWETPKLKDKLFTKEFGLITDCLSEICKEMRKYDFTNAFADYFELNQSFNIRDETAVRRTFSGMAKLIYPDGIMSKEEMRELLEYAIECRRRVKEQLKKMASVEFSDINLGYIDKEANKEYIIEVPEKPHDTLVYDGFEQPGFVYAIGRSDKDAVAVYRLENRLLEGSGELQQKNIEGLFGHKQQIKQALIAAFNYFALHSKRIINADYKNYDYALYYNDLQSKGLSYEITVAEVVGLCSALANRPVMPSLIIVGRVVMSGSMMPITIGLTDIILEAKNAGAKHLLLPRECKEKYEKLPKHLKSNIKVIFYSSPIDAAKKALGSFDE